jgi:hypothetical protein
VVFINIYQMTRAINFAKKKNGFEVNEEVKKTQP